MKKTFILLVVLLINSCTKDQSGDCLPYAGKIYGIGCGAMAVKVLNHDVNSKIYTAQNSFESNVIDVWNLPDSIPVGKEFYFDFREIQPGDEGHTCLAFYAVPSRQIVLTKFSYRRCDLP